MNQPDKVLRDRMIPAGIDRFADELGLPAEARDILLVIDCVSSRRILPVVNIVKQNREAGQRGDDVALRRRLLDFDWGLTVR